MRYNARSAVAQSESSAVDEGLRLHMNKVYGTMAMGMLLTFATAWGLGTNPAAVAALFTGVTRYIVMFAPLVAIFAFMGVVHQMSAAAAQVAFYVFSAIMGVSISYIFAVYASASIAQCAGVPHNIDSIRRIVAVGIHHEEGHFRVGKLPHHGHDRFDCGDARQSVPAVGCFHLCHFHHRSRHILGIDGL